MTTFHSNRRLAHRVLTAHLVCQGRLSLGVGAGSTKADFDAIGLDFDQRMPHFEEALAVMRRLWRGERVGSADLTPWPTPSAALPCSEAGEGRAGFPGPTATLDDLAPFHLRCTPDVAAERLRRLADLGFDDAIIVPRHPTEKHLTALRALH